MREKKNFAERVKVLPSDEVKKKYFMVYEGRDTERIYFEAVNEYRDDIKINPLIEFVPLLRSYSEEGWSNPKKILDRVLQNISEINSEQIRVETLLNWVMEYLYDVQILTTSRVDAANMWATLKLICEEKLDLELTSYIDKLDLEQVCSKIAQYFLEETDLASIIEDVPKIINNRTITYDEGFDKICFVIDRDRHSFVSKPNNDQYDYVLKICKEKGFGFYLSNPCFEFWLLLHFNQVKQLDEDKLLNNPKVTSNYRYVEHELRKLLPGYRKSGYSIEKLIPNVDIAIQNEADYCENEEELKYSVGSRVGLLIKELRE